MKYRLGLSRASYNLGSLYVINLNNIRKAMEYLDKARAIYQGLVEEHPSVGQYRADLAKAYGQIGSLFRFQVPPDESLVSFERARVLLEGLVHDHPTITRYRGDLALSEYNIGDRQLAAGRHVQALVSFRQALNLCEPLLKEAPKNALLKRQMATVLHGRGIALAALKRFLESAQAFERAIAVFRESYEASTSTLFRQEVSWETVDAHEELIKIWRALAQREKVMEVICSAIAVIEKLPPLAPWDMEHLARFYSEASGEIGQGAAAFRLPTRRGARLYASRAVDLLRRSMEAGYVSTKHLTMNRSYEPLYGRGDFQELLMDSAMPEKPFAQGP